MATMRTERTASAPADHVWAVMTDLDRAPEVMSAISRIERLDGGGAFGVGTRWRETRTVLGREATEEMEVTAVDPGRSYVVEADSRGARYRSTLGVDPGTGGHSRLWMDFEAEPTGPLSKVMAATLGRLFEGTIRKGLERDLADIAAAAERDSGQRADPSA